MNTTYEKPDGRIAAHQLKYAKKQVFCYGWWRPSTGKYLYIGQTTIGYKRLQTHSIIGRGIDFEPLDEIHFWYPVNPAPDTNEIVNHHWDCIEVARMEKCLITQHQPTLNCNELGVHRTQQACKHCTQPFFANRPWQEFCSKKCREAHWQAKPKEEKAILKICVHCKKQYELLFCDINLDRSYLCPTCRNSQTLPPA